MPKMSWRDFLELSKELRADPRFVLSNQDVEGGLVRFRTESRLNLLKDLGFDFNTWRATLEEVRHKANKDGVDWYVARCPSCADRGNPDTKGHGLNFSDEGIVHCHRGCTYWQVIGAEKPAEEVIE